MKTELSSSSSLITATRGSLAPGSNSSYLVNQLRATARLTEFSREATVQLWLKLRSGTVRMRFSSFSIYISPSSPQPFPSSFWERWKLLNGLTPLQPSPAAPPFRKIPWGLDQMSSLSISLTNEVN